jgi:hypothetical protein
MEIKDLLKTAAPMIGAAIGGPFGSVAVKLLSDALDKPDATAEDLPAILASATPEQMAAAQEANTAFATRMAELGFDNEQKISALVVEDVKSARQASVDGGTTKHLFWLSIVLLIISLGTEIVVLLKGLPEGTNEIIAGRVLGLMDSVAMMVLAFWYGSSLGSKQKTEQQTKG